MNQKRLFQLILAVFILSVFLPSAAFAVNATAIDLQFKDESTSGKTIALGYSSTNIMTLVTLPISADLDLEVTSSNPKIAEASLTGPKTITVKTKTLQGTAVISVLDKNSNRRVTARVSVQRLATGLTILGVNEVYAGSSISMQAEVTPSDATNKQVKWKLCAYSTAKAAFPTCTPNESVSKTASISGSGVLTAKNVVVNEKVKVVACTADGNVCTNKDVTVKISPESIKIIGPNEVYGGKSLTLKTELTPADSVNKQLKWKLCKISTAKVNFPTCSETEEVSKIAKITGGGILTAFKVDSNQKVKVVVCTANNSVCTNKDVTVKPSADKIRVYNDSQEVTSSNPLTIEVKDKLKLTAKTEPNVESDFEWTSSSPDIVTVNKTTGEIEGKSKGTVNITVKTRSGSVTTTVKVRVIGKKAKLKEIQNPSGISELVDGQSIQLKAVFDSVTADNLNVSWSVKCKNASDCPDGVPATIVGGKLTGHRVTKRIQLVITAKTLDGLGSSVTYDKIWVVAKIKQLRIVDGGKLDKLIKESAKEKFHWNDLTNVTAPVIFDLKNPDKTVKLTALIEVEPDVLAVTKSVRWSSSNRSVANVDSAGNVTFYKPGSVTITAATTDGSNLKATVTITAHILPESIKITGATVLGAGRSMTLKASIYPANVTVKSLSWSSSDIHVATVNNSGRVTAMNVKTDSPVKICVSTTDVDSRIQENVRSCVTITVYPVVTAVNILDSSSTIVTGKTILVDVGKGSIQLGAVTEPSGASNEVSWTSSNKKVAEVNGSGKVTIKGVLGTTSIVAKAKDGSGKYATVNIRVVNQAKSISLTIEPSGPIVDGSLSVRGNTTLKLKAAFGDPQPTNKSVTWNVSNGGAFSIGSGQKSTNITVRTNDVTKKTCTNVTVTAGDGSGKKDTKKICVYPSAKSVSIFSKKSTPYVDITGTSLTIKVGDSLKVGTDFIAKGYPSVDPDYLTTKWLWASSNTGVLSYDRTTHTFKGLKPGTSAITAKINDGSNRSAKITIKVEKAGGSPGSVSIGDESSAVFTDTAVIKVPEQVIVPPVSISGPGKAVPGESFSLTLLGSDGNSDVFWFSSNEEAAKIDTTSGTVQFADNAVKGTVVTFTAIVNDGKGTSAAHEVMVDEPVEIKVEIPDSEADQEDLVAMAVNMLLGVENENRAPHPEESEPDPMPEGESGSDLEAYVVPVSTEEQSDPVAEPVAPEMTEEPVAEDVEPVQDEPVEVSDHSDEISDPDVFTEDESADPEDLTVIEPVNPTDVPAEEIDVETIVEATPEQEETTTDDNTVPTDAAPVAEETQMPVDEQSSDDEAGSENEVIVPAPESFIFDVEGEEVSLKPGETFILASDKLKTMPEAADWSALKFEIEDKTVAELESEEPAKIRDEGLKIKGLTVGQTKLIVKSGEEEKASLLIVVRAEQPAEVPTEVSAETPTEAPVEAPTEASTEAPIAEPTAVPTEVPTEAQTAEPTAEPTAVPTEEPVEAPAEEPTAELTEEPTPEPVAEEPVEEVPADAGEGTVESSEGTDAEAAAEPQGTGE